METDDLLKAPDGSAQPILSLRAGCGYRITVTVVRDRGGPVPVEALLSVRIVPAPADGQPSTAGDEMQLTAEW